MSAASDARKKARNALTATKLKARIAEQLKRGANKGVEACIRFLAARIKETLSIPAPRRAIRARPLPGKKLGGIIRYVATTKAVPGAPPRKLSGRMRQSVTQKMLTPTVGIVGLNARSEPSKRYPQGFNYPAHHELGKKGEGGWGQGKHKFIQPTVIQYRKELRIIAGATIKTELRIKR